MPVEHELPDHAGLGDHRHECERRDLLLGSTSVHVKEFLPDRMKIESHLTKEGTAGWVAPEGIDIQFQGGVLTLRAKSEETELPEGASWLVHEVTPGEYIRQVTLPRSIDADKAETTFEDGILTLTLPKTADAKPKHIKVGSARQIGAGSNGS